MSIQNLREERTAKAREYRNTLDNNPGKLSEEVVAKLNELESDITNLDERLAREERIIQFAAEEVAVINAAEHVARKGSKEGPSASALLDKWMRGGDKAMSAEDWTQIRNTMSTTTDGQGGYTVAEEVASVVLDALKAFGGMRNVATVIRTAQGNPMSWPTSDGTSETGEILAENAAAADADPSFGTKALPVYKYSSKVVTVPIELLMDSSVDMEAFVRSRIAQRLGRITNTHFTVGDGSSKPTGIVAGASVGKTGATGQIASVIYNDLVDLEHSVDPAYRVNGKWMFSDTVLKLIKKLLDSQNRPLWLPDVAGNAPATILGYGYQINQDVAVPAASAKSVVFGDLSKYVIRDVMSLTYHRFDDSAFAKKGQVGFLAFLRSGGNYMDVGGAVKVFQNPAE
jgi:HK97 family phage major capsid protein